MLFRESQHNFSLVQNVLKTFNLRYMIIGSFAMFLHGLYQYQYDDIDIWLDPNSSIEEWKRDINGKSASAVIWQLSETKISAKILTTPRIDVCRNISGTNDESYASIFDQCLKSNFGPVAPVYLLIQSKYASGRHKDFDHMEKLANKILSLNKNANLTHGRDRHRMKTNFKFKP